MKLILVILNIALLIALAVRAFMLNIFSNTFSAVTLAILSLLIGAAVGFFIAKKNDDTNENNLPNSGNYDEFEQYKLYATSIIGTMMVCFVLLFNVNYLLSINAFRTESTFIEEIQPFIKVRGGIMAGEKLEPSAYHVFFKKEGDLERVRFEVLDNYESFIKSNLNLVFRKGLLGFDCFYPNKSLSLMR